MRTIARDEIELSNAGSINGSVRGCGDACGYSIMCSHGGRNYEDEEEPPRAESDLSTGWGNFVGRFDRDRTTDLRPISQRLSEHRGWFRFPDAHGAVVPASRKHYGGGTPNCRVDGFLLMTRKNLEECSSRAVPNVYMTIFASTEYKVVLWPTESATDDKLSRWPTEEALHKLS